MTSDTSGSLSFLRTQLRRHAGEVVPVGTESPTHLDVADDDDGHTGDHDRYGCWQHLGDAALPSSEA